MNSPKGVTGDGGGTKGRGTGKGKDEGKGKGKLKKPIASAAEGDEEGEECPEYQEPWYGEKKPTVLQHRD
eukprot:2434302-Prorocentrum_lima.AAC.1